MTRNAYKTTAVMESFFRPVVYPPGDHGSVFADPKQRPMSLIVSVLASDGSPDPWSVPYGLSSRLGCPMLPQDIEGAGAARITEAAAGLYNRPERLGKWIWRTASIVNSEFGGDASWIWNGGSGIRGRSLFSRLMDLPGVGAAKAMMLVAVLQADWDVEVTDWERGWPDPTESVARMFSRLGWNSPPPLRKAAVIYESARAISKEHCLESPTCDTCPLGLVCPRIGEDEWHHKRKNQREQSHDAPTVPES